MAVTLIVNPGSSSKKYALYVGDTVRLAAHVEHDEKGVTFCTTVNGETNRCEPVAEDAFATSLLDFLERALHEKIITSTTEISAVGVRIVAPGTEFSTHQIVSEAYIKNLSKKASEAPLHIPHIVKELTMLKQALPHATLVAASDSAFHTTLPERARRYSLAATEAKALDLYRFGYHGLSVASVIRRLSSVGVEAAARVIVCHIGSGVSVTAVCAGASVDTTMGYAPGSGLIMGSRAGDLDAGALLALMQTRNLRPQDAQTYLQTYGGLRGLGQESDLRILLQRRSEGNREAALAVESFVYGIQKAIGSYVAALGGIDALIFTATAAERSPLLRELITAPLSSFGIGLDSEKNNAAVSRDGVLSPREASVVVALIKANEAEEIWQVTRTFTV